MELYRSRGEVEGGQGGVKEGELIIYGFRLKKDTICHCFSFIFFISFIFVWYLGFFIFYLLLMVNILYILLKE